MEPLFSKRRLWVWPLLYFLLPWLLGLFYERFRNRWTEEWWLLSFASSNALHEDTLARSLLQPVWPLGQIPDQRILTLVENGKAHPDQMAWVTGRILQKKGMQVSWVHADGHAYSFLECKNRLDTFCLDPFYGVRWVGSAESYVLYENFQKEVFQQHGGSGHVYFAFRPWPTLVKIPFSPESSWIKGMTMLYGWWPWVGLDRLWVLMWSDLP